MPAILQAVCLAVNGVADELHLNLRQLYYLLAPLFTQLLDIEQGMSGL